MENPYDNFKLKTVHLSEKMLVAEDITINIGASSSMGSSQISFKAFDGSDNEIGNVTPLDGSPFVVGSLTGVVTGFSQVPGVAVESEFANTLDLAASRAFAPNISSVSQFRFSPAAITGVGATAVKWQAVITINKVI